MPDFHGSIQHVIIAETLWLLVVFPLLAALFAARFALAPRIDARAREAIAIVSLGAVAASLVIAAYHAWFLAGRPEGERFIVQHCWRLVRLGQLDASFDLALDPLSSTMSLLVTGVGACIFVFASASAPLKGDVGYARFFTWMNALVAAMLLLVLADNFILLLVGWEGIGLCAWGLCGFAWGTAERGRRRAGSAAFLVRRIGDASLLLGIALFYWGFGGTWLGGDYAPDLGPRFVSVDVREPVAEAREEATSAGAAPVGTDEDEEESPSATASDGREGYLTLASYAGAVVFMDDARTPLESPGGNTLRAPFVRAPVRAGLHSFRVRPGGGLDDFLVTHVAFGEGREIALSPLGPTVNFREARDQLAMRDAHGNAVVRGTLLEKRGWGATGVVTVACLLLFFGVVGMAMQLPFFMPPPEGLPSGTPVSAMLQACTITVASVYVLTRLAFFFVLSPAACSVVAVAGVAMALVAATAGLFQYDLKRLLACTAASQLGLMVLAIGASGYTAAVFHLVTSALSTALLVLAGGSVALALRGVVPESEVYDVRRLGGLGRALPTTAWAFAVGCLAVAAAPVPGLAGFWSKDEVLVRALTARSLVFPGYALFFAAILATALTAFSVWRAYYLVFDGPPAAASKPLSEPGSPIPQILLALAGASALAGVVLGVSPSLFGKEGAAPFEAWLAPNAGTFAHEPLLVEWGVLVATCLAGATAWMLARTRYRRRDASWEASETASPLFVLSRSGFGIEAAFDVLVMPVAFFVRDLAAELDRRVIDGFVNGVALATRALAWVVARIDDGLVDGAVRGFSRGVQRAGERVQVAPGGRVQTFVYVLVLGVLALALLPYWLR
jgi:NADH-quinone oxidoreductase subunit L